MSYRYTYAFYSLKIFVRYTLHYYTDDKKLLYSALTYNWRFLAENRRKQSRRKAIDFIMKLFLSAQKAELTANIYCLQLIFFPKDYRSIKAGTSSRHNHYSKKSNKVKYEYYDRQLNIKEIYGKNRKLRERFRYLFSVEITVG